ncbi:MAG TPA: serine protease [Pseudonocardiaceae bacterium]|jgi:secreted trypsin-like serine protease|nr:serine protease [Pseudonocardiaceae bacterium]
MGRAGVVSAVVLAVLCAPTALAVARSISGPAAGSPAEPRIVGGQSAHPTEYPWMVALTTTASKSPYCGGALVSPDRVLTAAHCISGYELSSVRVIAGRTDLRSDDGAERSLLRAWVHPDFRSPTEGADVAVLTLDREVPYRTLPLETDQSAYRAGVPATVLGWGYTSEGGPTSPVLRSAEVPLVADSDCAGIYREFNPRTMVCAGDPEGGVDACYGDSGGPLVADGRLIGITSWGSGCARAHTPGVFVRVASYVSDIDAALSEPASVRSSGVHGR